MALTLRNELGDIIKWKVILIVELIILAIVGLIIGQPVIQDMFSQQPPEKPVNNKPTITPRVPEGDYFTGVVEGKSLEYRDLDTLYMVILYNVDGKYYVVEYPRRFGKFYRGEIVSVWGEIQPDKMVIIANEVILNTLDGEP